MIRRFAFVIAAGLLFASCESGPDTNALYRMEKQYWDADDYNNAIYRINSTQAGQKKPCYAVPETAPIFAKLANKENVAVIVGDEALGVKHRADFAEAMFNHSRNMIEEYNVLDREDKFEYPQEMVDMLTFHLYVQPFYFELGNEHIRQEADNPEDPDVKRVISSNEQTLVSNYIYYLDFAEQDKAFTPDALSSYIDGMNEYFPALITKYPNANYSAMKEKANAMLAKTGSPEVKTALTNLVAKIDANTAAIEAAKMAADSTGTVTQ